MTGVTISAEECPFHTGTEAQNRQAIAQGLGRIINPLMVELCEMVEGGAIDLGPLGRREVKRRPYEDVRAEARASRAYTFGQEEARVVAFGARARFSDCLETDIPLPVDVPETSPLRIPIGFDTNYSDRQIRAASGVVQGVGLLAERINMVAAKGENPRLILSHTYQGVITGDPVRALRKILYKGVARAAQAEAILSASPVEGYGSASDLAGAVREADLPKELTFCAGTGMLRMLVQHGRYVEPPLVRTGGGELGISPQIKQYAQAITRSSHQTDEARSRMRGARGTAMQAPAEKELHLRLTSGAMCPAYEGVPAALRAIAHVAARLEPR